MVTKSGTNELHGSLCSSSSETGCSDANDYFNKDQTLNFRGSISKSAINTGATFGGLSSKNKIFSSQFIRDKR